MDSFFRVLDEPNYFFIWQFHFFNYHYYYFFFLPWTSENFWALLDSSCPSPLLATTQQPGCLFQATETWKAFFSSPFYVTLHSIVRTKQWACCQHKAFEEILCAAVSGLREPGRPLSAHNISGSVDWALQWGSLLVIDITVHTLVRTNFTQSHTRINTH